MTLSHPKVPSRIWNKKKRKNEFSSYKMFACPICSDWVLVNRLCGDCDKIRQLTKIYGKDKVLGVLDKVMIIQRLVETPEVDEN